jgi:holo-[acyl-carrier protein] synthase
MQDKSRWLNMIKGLGIDMIETARIANSIAKESGFRELVFSPGEIAYCEAKADKSQYYAARFAAKEAFLKALGTGWKNGTAFNEIEITNDGSGKPEIRLLGETLNTIREMAIGKISVSLSHLKDIAAAVVIIEQ